ncbi:MAG TPA: hypothetical protein VF763_05395 [Candidatus Limnocylindrales bacterium]
MAALALSLAAVASVAAAPAAHASQAAQAANSGTLKIHQGATDDATAAAGVDIDTDPHVCTFHLHWFFGAAGETGTWWIEAWSPDANAGTVMLRGTFTADVHGEYRTAGSFSLPAGHYKAFWEDHGSTTTEVKAKVFWVDCTGGVAGATATPGATESEGTGETGETTEQPPCSDTDEIGDNDADNHPCPTSTPTATATAGVGETGEANESTEQPPCSDTDEIGDNDADNHPCPTSTPTVVGGVAGETATPAPTLGTGSTGLGVGGTGSVSGTGSTGLGVGSTGAVSGKGSTGAVLGVGSTGLGVGSTGAVPQTSTDVSTNSPSGPNTLGLVLAVLAGVAGLVAFLLPRFEALRRR